MRLIRGLHNVPSVKSHLNNGCVLTIGNFDGIHLGHQRILQQVASLASELKVPSVVMIFEPLPVEFFAPQKAPVRLMNLREKLDGFQQTDIDYVLVCRFNQQFADHCPQDFVEDLLVKQLKIKHLVIGDDFRFGKNRAGNFDYLKTEGQKFGFAVSDMPTFELDQQRVSSTRIRQALSEHDLSEAEKLLDKPFYFKGRVIHGKKLGRQLGFRTLNLNPKRLQMPLEGVYTVYVSGLADQDVAGVANIGVRPTVDGLRPSIEVHLFNWSQEVYGKHVGVKIHQFIRSEMQFDNIDQLKSQIAQDVEKAKQLLQI